MECLICGEEYDHLRRADPGTSECTDENRPQERTGPGTSEMDRASMKKEEYKGSRQSEGAHNEGVHSPAVQNEVVQSQASQCGHPICTQCRKDYILRDPTGNVKEIVCPVCLNGSQEKGTDIQSTDKTEER